MEILKCIRPKCDSHVDCTLDVILENVDGCVVEIGMGKSTFLLAHFAKLYGRKMYSCDSNKRKTDWYKENVDYDNFEVYHGKSYLFVENFDSYNDVPALVFLDGSHRYKALYLEANFFLERLVPGGVMFIHDTYIIPKWYERYELKGKAHKYDTYKIRQDLEANDSVWCLTFPYTAAECGLTMVLKKEEDRPFYRL